MKFDSKLEFPYDSDESALIIQFPKTVQSVVNQIIAERVEFYKKWKGNPNGLAMNGTNIFNRFADWFNKNYGVKYIRTKTFDEKFDDWLFDYTFSDVVGD